MRAGIGLGIAALLAGCGGSARDQAAADSARTLAAMPPTAEVIDSAVTSAQELRPAPEVIPGAAQPRAEPRPKAAGKPASAAPRPATQPAASAAAPMPAPPPPPPSAKAGTEIVTSSVVEITTRRNKAGEKFSARVTEAVKDEAGREVIPAGAIVTFLIVDSKEAENKDAAGTLVIRPLSLEAAGDVYELQADVTGLEPEKKGRGVTGGDAAKVGAGAAAGAILGQIITKKAGGTIIGGVVGGAVGTAIAVKSADKDLVIPAGSRIVIRLTGDFVRKQ